MSFLARTAPSAQELAREAYIKKTITESLGRALKTLQQKHVHSEEPIYSEDRANMVCNILEAVFLHGLKSSFSHKLSSYLIGIDPSKNKQPSFWELLTRISHRDVVSQLNHLGQITTEIGMCRAWLRVALNDGVLESYLDAILADRILLRYFYKSTSYLRDEEQAGIFKSYSQGIQNFRFQLSYNSSVLNIWTTTPLVLAGLREPTVTPHAIMPSSSSEGALSQISAASSVDENEGMVSSGGHHVYRSKASQPRISSSCSYNEGLQHSAAAGSSDQPIPHTPFNPASLSRTEIEEIRKFTEQTRCTTGSPSTPTSQISCPDYDVEGRFVSSPDATVSIHSMSSTRSPTTSEHARHENQSGCASVEMLVEEEVVQQDDGEIGVVTVVADNSVERLGDSRNMEEYDVGSAGCEDNVISGNLADEGAMGHVADDNLLAEAAGSEQAMESQEEQPSPIQTTMEEKEGEAEGYTAGDLQGQCPQEQPRTSHQAPAIRPKTIEASLPDQSSDITLPPLQLCNRKSEVLQPVLTDVTAQVEIAHEVSTTTALVIDAEETMGGEAGIYDEFPVSPQSNQLGAMQGHGWSSEFEKPEALSKHVKEEVPAEVLLHRETSFQESYNAMLRNYSPSIVPVPSMSQVLDNLPGEGPEVATTSPIEPAQTLEGEDEEECWDYLQDYDILPAGLNVTSSQADARTRQLVTLIGQICNEKGLDQQNYQCNGCSRSIGMIYGKARDCAYDGSYYCYECHENEEAIIPSRIVHNWDFSKYKVSCHTMVFLKQIEEDPLLNIQHINPRLYDHVPKIKEVREARTQLRFLKAYLFTCRHSVADDLRKQVWPREYLYDDIHLYSVQDLLQVVSGQLLATLRRVIKAAARHVYDCRLCSQKGFICEVCASPSVIYPFEAETTRRCELCNAVYHRECKLTSRECPKCIRRMQRQRTLGSELGEHDTVDYAYVPE